MPSFDRLLRLSISLAVFFLPLAAATAGTPRAADPALIAEGRYVTTVAGCNDCHTEHFAESGTAVPERNWLQGSRVGWSGPWGTSYAINLRLLVSRMTEADWLGLIRTMHPRPPMPWWSLRSMNQRDQRAVYVFIHALGPAGRSTPADLPPGIAAPAPVVQFPMPPGANR